MIGVATARQCRLNRAARGCIRHIDWDAREPRALRLGSRRGRTALSAAARGSGTGVRAHVLSACNEYRQETLILEHSALAGGFSFRPVGLGEPWYGLATKLALYDQALQELVGTQIPSTDPVMLVDAWDTVILGTALELKQKLAAYGALEGGKIVGAADRICAPEYKLAPRVERLYPNIQTPWRYPNSGGFAGTAEALAIFMHALVHGTEGGKFSVDGDDQLRVQEFLLGCAELEAHFPFRVDEDLDFFLCMGEPVCDWEFEAEVLDSEVTGVSTASGSPSRPRLRSRTTGTRPLVAHGCGGHGRWFLSDVYRELRLLDHLHVEQGDLEGLKYAGLVAPGQQVTEEQWVNQPPWDYPFQAFEVIRTMALHEECRG